MIEIDALVEKITTFCRRCYGPFGPLCLHCTCQCCLAAPWDYPYMTTTPGSRRCLSCQLLCGTTRGPGPWPAGRANGCRLCIAGIEKEVAA